MKPNILILSIDSLRFDKIFGKNKSALTPNIDKIIKSGVVFNQAISSADTTGVGVGSMFTAKFSYRTGCTQYKIDFDALEYLHLLKKNDYNTYATVPNIHFFLTLTKNFTEADVYEYFKRGDWLQLVGGIGDSIIDRLDIKNKDPWFHYIHLMDLHSPFYIPKEFDSEKFGKERYDRMISSIDSWIGRILEKIDLTNTLVILTADHGDHIPVIENWGKVTKTNPLLIKIKEKLPIIGPLGLIIITKFRDFKINLRIRQHRKNLTEKQLEALLGRAQNVLYDELLHIPLIFYGCGIQNQKIISQQVRQVDTFPTFIDMLNISDTNDVDGQSLVPLVNGDSLNELPAYIETGVRWVKLEKEIIEPKFEGKIIGIRTSSYKYWRSRTDSTKDVTLYDLQQDPNEEVNIAEKNQPIVDEMEQILNSMKKTFTPNNQNTFSSEEEKKIAAELTRLGYL
jgi:arylsulfatase A-like enzyme